MWKRWPATEEECGAKAVYSFPVESGGNIYLCEECRVRTGADKQHLTLLPQSPPPKMTE